MEKCIATGVIGDFCRAIPGHGIESCLVYIETQTDPTIIQQELCFTGGCEFVKSGQIPAKSSPGNPESKP